MKTKYDLDIETKMVSLDIEVKISPDNDIFFEILEKHFFIGLNRIDWEKSNCVISRNVDNKKGQAVSFLEFLEEIENLYPSILNEKVKVFGDESINQSYEMNYIDFKRIAEDFISFPQHTYVLTTSNKCINYTFEDEMFFGLPYPAD